MEPSPPAVDALGMELSVNCVRSELARVELSPEVGEAVIVLAPAERTWAMTGRERGRLVEKEQLRELPRLLERFAVPAAKLKTAGDPAPGRPGAANPTALVVQAAAVTVNEAARGVRDQLAERRDPVLEWHSLGKRVRETAP
jgi:hypothetical protein